MLQILESGNKEDPQYTSTQMQVTVDPVESKESEIVLIDDRTQTNYESSNKKDEIEPIPEPQKVPISQYHPLYQPTLREIDLNPDTVFKIDPVSYKEPYPALPHITEDDPRQITTMLEPETLQVQSPAKRREYSVTEELNLDEHKEQKVPKKKKPSLPAAKDVQEVFYVTIPDNTTVTLLLDSSRTLGAATRVVRQRTGIPGYLNLNGIYVDALTNHIVVEPIHLR